MSDLALVIVGIGIGLALSAGMLGQAWAQIRALEKAKDRAEIATAIEQAERRAVEKALGMVKDIVGNRQAPDTALNRFEAAVKAEAEHTAWQRRMRLEQAQANAMLDEGSGK